MEKLNKEQLKAVMHKDGPLLIVAGAGTGKTTVITQRIAYLIEQGCVKSDEILALTFTEKAAGEMEERVDRLLPMGYIDLWISTFHSFGEQMLRAHGLDIGLPADFKLLNEFEQYSLVKKNLENFELDYYQPLGNPNKFIRALLSHFSRLKDEDISPADYLEYAEELKQNMDNMLGGDNKIKSQKSKIKSFINKAEEIDFEIAVQEVNRINETANAYHVYSQLMLDNSFLDFGDLINFTLKLFRERPAILEKYRKQFKYIMLDEFQDTNWAQYELIKMLAGPKNNLVVVGDDDQSVYKFRGASVSNILQFKKDFPRSEQVFINKNYRNKQNILDLSYEFVKQNNPNRLEWQLSQKSESPKLTKRLEAQINGKGVIEVITGTDLQDEVKRVVEKIADLKIKDKSASWGDFGILVRANNSAKDFCAVLEVAGLPYRFFSSRGLYSKPVIMDVIAYLKLLDDYHESAAVYRVLSIPILGFSYQELINFNYAARKKAWSLFTILKYAQGKFGIETQKKIDKLLGLISKHSGLTRNENASEIVLAFLNDSGCLKHISKEAEKISLEKIAYLNQFMKRIKIFEANNDDKSVKAFLAELTVEMEAGEQGSLPFDVDSSPESIKVMTVHSAKGLEFKYVFLPNMVDKRFPSIERKEAIIIPDALIKEILPEGDIHLEEERRLFYVAMTRAKENIYFSWAPDYGGVRVKKPSRFLVEVGLVDESQRSVKLKAKEYNKFSEKELGTKKKPAFGEKLNYKLPFYLSFSQLSSFNDCPYKYRYSYVLKIPIKGKCFFSFGETMHSVMQKTFELAEERNGLGQADLFKSPAGPAKKSEEVDIKLEEMLEIYARNWIDNWYESDEQKQKYKKLGKKIIKEFHKIHNKNWPKTLLLEKGFNLKIKVNNDIYSLKGIIDRVDMIGDEVKIVDYKTGKPKKKLMANNKNQLLIYQMALQDVFKYKVKALSFYYLEDNSEVEFLGSEKELDTVQEKIVSVIKDINRGEFPSRPGPLCAFCDYKDICEYKKA